jgi:hypothetical protein
MKVRDLIRELSCFDDEQEVCIAQPSHDYWGTTCASEVNNIEIADVTWSEYHRKDKVVDDDHIEHYEKEELKSVVLLS